MKVLELFAGTRSIGKAFEARGHKVYSVEWDKRFDHIDLYADVLKLTAEDVLRGQLPRWIPAEERLPEDRSDVLVVAYWHERWGAYMGWCAPERAAWSVHVGIGDRNDVAVTHWMPLPEPPEEER